MYYEVLEVNNRPISKREREIIVLIAAGYTNLMISRELCIGRDTVNFHIRNISNKLRAKSKVSIAVCSILNGTISLDEVAPIVTRT